VATGKNEVTWIIPGLYFAVVVAAAAVVAEVLLVVDAVLGVQKPQASAQRSATKFLSFELAESEQAPFWTSVLHVVSSAMLLQSGLSRSVVEFATQTHRKRHLFVLLSPLSPVYGH